MVTIVLEKAKHGEKHCGNYHNTDSFFGTIWSTVDPKTSENGLLPRRNVFALPLGFTDVFDRRVLFQKAKNALLGSEVLIQRS